MREDTEELTEGLEYTVELTDASGNTVSVDSPVLVYHSLAVQLIRITHLRAISPIMA